MLTGRGAEEIIFGLPYFTFYFLYATNTENKEFEMLNYIWHIICDAGSRRETDAQYTTQPASSGRSINNSLSDEWQPQLLPLA